jgi:protein-S-isoprenylcysteine O-methyltransferase Ste14
MMANKSIKQAVVDIVIGAYVGLVVALVIAVSVLGIRFVTHSWKLIVGCMIVGAWLAYLTIPIKEGMESIDGEGSSESIESHVYNSAETLPGRPE